MCTRYYMDDAPKELSEILMKAKQSKLADTFVKKLARPVITSGEVRPTDVVPVIAPNASRQRSVFPMQWGFKNPDHDSTVFNARSETAANKPTFKDAWKSHRCIVPASWYFEWQHYKSPDGKTKTGDKYTIQPAGYDITWLCGLYRMDDDLPHFVILTREPAGELAKIHDRMPLILPKEKIDEWIQPDIQPESLLPYALTDMIFEKCTVEEPKTDYSKIFSH